MKLLLMIILGVFATSLLADDVFVPAGSLLTRRVSQSATMLPNGKILIVGGQDQTTGQYTGTAELYDPSTGTSTATGSLVLDPPLGWASNFRHTATLLANGNVLMAGGQYRCEVYDPATGLWALTGTLNARRFQATTILLNNGKVLTTGGTQGIGEPAIPLASCELYDPATGVWTTTGALGQGRFGHSLTLLANGKVLLVGGTGTSGDLTGASLYDPTTGVWTDTTPLTIARSLHTATLLPNGKVLVIGGSFASTVGALYDPVAGTWTDAGPFVWRHKDHSATLVGTRVLIVGGYEQPSTPNTKTEYFDIATNRCSQAPSVINGMNAYRFGFLLSSGRVIVLGGNSLDTGTVESFSPNGGSWSSAAALATARSGHTSTLLPTGRILLAGGRIGTTSLATTGLYDPLTGTWSSGALSTARADHTGTVLLDGRILFTGGVAAGASLTSAEIYNPATGLSTATGNMIAARSRHTATLLASGLVLVTGGRGASASLSSAELFNPATGVWSAAPTITTVRQDHTAVALPNGNVLISGGSNGTTALLTAQIYQTAAGTWASTGSLGAARTKFTATLLPNGKVLAVGGASGSTPLASAELYDPATGLWTATANLSTARSEHTALLLANGQLLLTGGVGASPSTPIASAERFDPTTSKWIDSSRLLTARRGHSATLLPSGYVLVAAGLGAASADLASTEFYDVAAIATSTAGAGMPKLYGHTATLLPNGRVLVAGGIIGNGQPPLYVCYLYDSVARTWATTGQLSTARSRHAAVLLPNGKVLVVGGGNVGGLLATAELYDPATAAWTNAGTLTVARNNLTATLLPSGKVLVVGGSNGTPQNTAELYDPIAGLWTVTGSLNSVRAAHTATLLPNGKVLVAGGYSASVILNTSEVYDPATGLWTNSGLLPVGFQFHTATLLPNGQVLVIGESGSALYDPATGTSRSVGNPDPQRKWHTATLLTTGDVLVQGGTYTANAVIYHVATNTWTATAGLLAARQQLTATLLPDGRVLTVGGYFTDGMDQTELYDLGLGVTDASRPKLTSVALNSVGGLVLTGTGFRGTSTGSGGNGTQDSPASPLVRITQANGGSQSFILTAGNTTPTSITTASVDGLGSGNPYFVSVIVQGISSLPMAFLPPNLVIEQPSPIQIADGGSRNMSCTSRTPDLLTFTVKNTGGVPLTNVVLTMDGANSSDFVVTASPASTVAPGASTSFTVKFSAVGNGPRVAVLHLASNAGGNSYDIHLNGQLLSYGTDTDGDGMSDAAEFDLEVLGFDWQDGSSTQVSMVTTYYANANSAGLYTPRQVQDLNVGIPLIQRDSTTGIVKLTVSVQKTTNLGTIPFADFPMNGSGSTTVINAAGKLEFSFPVADTAAFFRLQSN